jgi:hypothetical protein
MVTASSCSSVFLQRNTNDINNIDANDTDSYYRCPGTNDSYSHPGGYPLTMDQERRPEWGPKLVKTIPHLLNEILTYVGKIMK